jgi:5'-nucleotidase
MGIDLQPGGFVLDQDRELLPFGTMRLREFADSTNVVNMAYSMEGRLVIAVASSALFDLRESDREFREGNLEAYRSYQRDHENDVLPIGVAFPLIRRLLALNDRASDYCPVDVVLLSRNDADTGLRVFKSIEKYGLDITRAAFVSGRDPFRYLEAFSATLFLSANPSDVLQAIARNVPAGQVFPTDFIDDDSDDTIRIAFDFDGVLADDSAESVFQQRRLEGFLQSEVDNARVPMPFGPLHRFFVQIARIQERELNRCQTPGRQSSRIRTAIITARNAPAHERVITTLRSWGIHVDEALFLGGIDKSRVLSEFKPHIFFDDQLTHVTGAAGVAPCAHVPFGIVNGIVLTDLRDSLGSKTLRPP